MSHIASRRVLSASLVLTLLITHCLAAEVQIGRYARAQSLPTDAQRDALAATNSIRCDSVVKSAGDAVAVILEESAIHCRIMRPPIPNACFHSTDQNHIAN